jgi:hypothetical protein
MFNHEAAIAEAEHRIRLLTILADALAGLGRTEEMLAVVRAIVRLRGELGGMRLRARLLALRPIET